MHNQVDYTLCESCGDLQDEEAAEERHSEAEYLQALRIKREARNKASRERYWLPKNVKKRKTAKIEKKRLGVEQMRRSFAETFSIVDNMMGN